MWSEINITLPGVVVSSRVIPSPKSLSIKVPGVVSELFEATNLSTLPAKDIVTPSQGSEILFGVTIKSELNVVALGSNILVLSTNCCIASSKLEPGSPTHPQEIEELS